MLATGEKAPDFSLSDKSGQQFSLASFAGKQLVLYFYPKDDTPGCTIEAQAFSRALPEFEKRGVQVVGISGGDDASKQRFCDKYNLQLTLLSDPDASVARAYGVYGMKTFLGKSYLGIHRSTFVLSADGTVLKAYDSVKPEYHTDEVLAFLDGREFVPPVKEKLPAVRTKRAGAYSKPAKKSSKSSAKASSKKKVAPKAKVKAKKPSAKKSATKKVAAKKTASKKLVSKKPSKKAPKKSAKAKKRK
jgi:peroxiredoxin Q/BCP